MNIESQQWYRVSLRFLGGGVNPEEITRSLGVNPSESGLAGDSSGTRWKYATNTWIWNSSLGSEVSFDEQLNCLLNVIEPQLENIKTIISRPDVEADFFLGFSSESGQGSAYFSPELLARLASTGIPLLLDLYPPGES